MSERNGIAVMHAANGKLALEAYHADRFEFILMDVQMSVMDGLKATAAIREAEASHGGHIPIIALTAHAMKGDRERCLEAGMDGYTTKPIKEDGVLSSSRRCWPGERAPGRARRA